MMIQNLKHILTIFFFFLMLVTPDIIFSAASDGLLLWFQIVLPTLLPFLIISSFLLHTPAIHLLVRITAPFFCRLFHVSKYGSFAVLCGFLCGYPMGGKITSDLLISGKITPSEASYLLSFCNNTSPMFIISYVMHQNLNAPHLILPALAILFLSPVLCSFIFRPFYSLTNENQQLLCPDIPQQNDKTEGSLIDECIMKSFETITKIGGYIILFSILIQLIKSIPATHLLIKYLLLPFLEITNGVLSLSKSLISFQDKFVIIMALISFGGWCSIAQTQSMIAKAQIPLFPYIIEKLITALVTSFLTLLFFKLY